MRAVVQRVSRARVTVNGDITGEITYGLMILLGVGRDDTSASRPHGRKNRQPEDLRGRSAENEPVIA